MKKMILVFTCLLIVMSVGGCESEPKKVTDNKDIFEVLKKEGYVFSLKTSETEGGSFTLHIDGTYQFTYYLIGDNYMMSLENKEMKSALHVTQNENGETYDLMIGDCILNINNNEKKGCEDTSENDVKKAKEQMDKDFNEIGITVKQLYPFGKWYMTKNKDSAVVQ